MSVGRKKKNFRQKEQTYKSTKGKDTLPFQGYCRMDQGTYMPSVRAARSGLGLVEAQEIVDELSIISY